MQINELKTVLHYRGDEEEPYVNKEELNIDQGFDSKISLKLSLIDESILSPSSPKLSE